MSKNDFYLTAIDIRSVSRHLPFFEPKIEERISNHLLREHEIGWFGSEAKLDIFDAKINESKCELYWLRYLACAHACSSSNSESVGARWVGAELVSVSLESEHTSCNIEACHAEIVARKSICSAAWVINQARWRHSREKSACIERD